MEFKDKLLFLRNQKNISQAQLAKAIDVSNAVISFWETGRNEPTLQLIKKLAVYFGVSTDYLLGLEDDFGAKEFDAPKIEHYSKAERELIATYRALSPGKKSALFEMLEIDTTVSKGKNQKLS